MDCYEIFPEEELTEFTCMIVIFFFWFIGFLLNDYYHDHLFYIEKRVFDPFAASEIPTSWYALFYIFHCFSVAQGIAFFKEGRQTEAMQQLNKALQIDTTNVEALVARGAL